MPVIELTSLDDTSLRDLCMAVPPCLLFGSAVSKWSPTDAPTGQAFTASLHEALFHLEA